MAVLNKLIALVPLLLLVSVDQACSKGVLYYREPEGNLDGTCPGVPNTYVPWTGEPTLKSNVTNGSLYTAGNGEDQVYGRKKCLFI